MYNVFGPGRDVDLKVLFGASVENVSKNLNL